MGSAEQDGRIRCAWAENSDAECAYHDAEWGVPLHGDPQLFEMLTLEGAQAGLSWRTVLLRRHLYREAFHGFDIARVAAMEDAELEESFANLVTKGIRWNEHEEFRQLGSDH